MSSRFISTILILVSLVASVAAQYRFDTWTTDNGLPQNGVREITQTPDGYLWFTTFDGLVRFDGVRFTTFNKSNTPGIINNRFTGVFVDTRGTLYATTMEDGVLTVYEDSAFRSYTPDQVPGLYINTVEDIGNGEIRILVEDEDRKHKSRWRFVDGRFEFVDRTPKGVTDSHLTGRSGVLWSVTREQMTRRDDNGVRSVPSTIGELRYRPNLFESATGELWVGSNRIFRFNGDAAQEMTPQRDDLSPSTIFHSFWQEGDGSIWAASGGANSLGIGLVQISGEEKKVWGQSDGLPSNSIMDVFRDREGTIWLATDKGLGRRRDQVITGLSKDDGLIYTEVYPMLRDKSGDIWVGTSRGLSIYRDGKFESPTFKIVSKPESAAFEKRLSGPMSVQALWQAPDGAIWVGLNGGIAVIENGRLELIHYDDHVFAINSDRDGNIWAASGNGLMRFRGRELVEKIGTAQGLPSAFMTTIFQDSRGTLWFGGYGGLSRYDDGRFTNFGRDDGLAGNYVRSIYEDADGTLWIGTYDEGMSRYRDGKFFNYNERNGLYNNGVFAIEEDSEHNFWISSNKGIYRVRRSQLNDLAEGKIDRLSSVGYGRQDGMLSAECNGGRQPASVRDADGRFWFPTQNGIAIVDPKIEVKPSEPPPVVIEKVSIEREPVEFNKGITIESGKKDIEIQYTGISFIKSDQIRFKHKLEGHDTDWVDAGTRRAAYYSNLKPGTYSFQVMAATSDGVWSTSPATMKFELKPYFYETRGFLLAMLGCGALLLLVIWKVSVHQLEAREKRLTRLVAARTEELAEANKALEALANSDGLTKIGNRRRFQSFLEDEWHRAIRFRTPISLVMIDIDHFKQYNDTYGHQAGDECLRRVADALAAAINRPTDLVVRFGGEEFAMILGGTDATGADNIAHSAVLKIRELRVEHQTSTTGEFLTVSVGVATASPGLGDTESEIITLADRALYLAKKTGRNRIVHYDPASKEQLGIHLSDPENIYNIEPPTPIALDGDRRIS